MLLKILLEDKEAIEEIIKHLTLEDFQDLRIREAMRVVYLWHAQGEDPSAAKLITYLRGEDAAQLISRISSCAEEFLERQRCLSDCISRIKADNLKDSLHRLQREIRLAQGWGHKEKLTELVSRYNHLIKTRSAEKCQKTNKAETKTE